MLRLSYVSAAGEEGYPGELTAHVTYRLDNDDALAIDYEASTTAATPVNLANHAYFNLTGDPQRTILEHLLTINADRITAVNATLIPTGELRSVAGTAFDFRKAHAISSRINDRDEQLRLGHGYDHNWVLNKSRPEAISVAAVQWRSARRNPACNSIRAIFSMLSRPAPDRCSASGRDCVWKHNITRIRPTDPPFRQPSSVTDKPIPSTQFWSLAPPSRRHCAD
jgi:hypothetical protein